jgi:dihydrofolate reductase
MRKIIAAFRVSLDGFIQGPNGEADWVDAWDDLFELMPQVDTCLLGGGMYPGYEQYWSAILANPNGVLPYTGKVPSKNEITYSKFAAETPHIVLSKTLKNVAWKTGRIVRDVEDIRKMKGQSGKDIYAVGGPTLVSNLMNVGLIDELQLAVHPIILGGGKALFKDITERHLLKLVEAKPFKSDLVKLIYTP